MNGFPWIQFYPRDWIADTRAISVAAKGAWIDVLCALHNSPTRGQATMDLDAWGRIMGAGADEAGRLIAELGRAAVAEVVTLCNGLVMVSNRRMLREEKAREKNRQRVRRHRQKIETPVETPIGNGQHDLFGNDLVTQQKPEARSQKPDNTLAPGKPARARNQAVDDLAAACSIDPLQMTADDARACAVAVAKIKRVVPGVDRAEMDRRAENYRLRWPEVSLTPSALSKNWAICDKLPTYNGTTTDQRPNGRHFKHAEGKSYPANKGGRDRLAPEPEPLAPQHPGGG